MAKIINADAFDTEVLKCDKPVLVDFFAEWCGPCKMIAPILEEITEELAENVKIVKIDVDSNKELAMSYSVRSIPSLLFFKGGVMADKHVGLLPKDEIIDKLNSLM